MKCMHLITYYVPTIRPVFASSSSFLKNLAIPKSEIFGFIWWSSRMLLAFKSRCTIVQFEYSWRYRSPWVIPSIILTRLFQSNICLLAGSATNFVVKWHGTFSNNPSHRRYHFYVTMSRWEMHTKEVKVQALVWHVFVYEHLLFPLGTISDNSN